MVGIPVVGTPAVLLRIFALAHWLLIGRTDVQGEGIWRSVGRSLLNSQLHLFRGKTWFGSRLELGSSPWRSLYRLQGSRVVQSTASWSRLVQRAVGPTCHLRRLESLELCRFLGIVRTPTVKPSSRTGPHHNRTSGYRPSQSEELKPWCSPEDVFFMFSSQWEGDQQ